MTEDDYAARLADDSDPLRRMLGAARAWRVAPTIFMGERTGVLYEHDGAGRVIRAVEWTLADSELAMALEDYELGFCPGGPHLLSETSKIEHTAAYQPAPPIRCHYCTTQALVSENAEKQHENTAGLLFPIVLNPDVVELNRQPIPPLPPELGGINGH